MAWGLPMLTAMYPEPATPKRRNQADRREAARAALLEATLSCLAEEGWAGTSTRSVARRAGLSQGAQQYHFASKMTLVEAALNYSVTAQAASVLEMPLPKGSEHERLVVLLDRLWEIHCSRVTTAGLELLMAARTDPALAESVARTTVTATNLTVMLAEQTVPSTAKLPGFRDVVLTALALMRGTAIAQLEGTTTAVAPWPVLRAHILAIVDSLAS
ncbi:TetR/AcrR family transcriptional regulator [Mycobacteroides abscessus]|nr:TetR/AcrR family transcriptional regulator [Mycobacteroides abscessus]